MWKLGKLRIRGRCIVRFRLGMFRKLWGFIMGKWKGRKVWRGIKLIYAWRHSKILYNRVKLRNPYYRHQNRLIS